MILYKIIWVGDLILKIKDQNHNIFLIIYYNQKNMIKNVNILKNGYHNYKTYKIIIYIIGKNITINII